MEQELDSQKLAEILRLKRFLKHLVLSTKKYEERDNARSEFHEQLSKIKDLSRRRDNAKLDLEIVELEKKIVNMLEKEKTILAKEGKKQREITMIAGMEKKLEKSEKSHKNVEVYLLEKQIADMESKYNKIKGTEKNKDILENIRARIDTLKTKMKMMKE